MDNQDKWISLFCDEEMGWGNGSHGSDMQGWATKAGSSAIDGLCMDVTETLLSAIYCNKLYTLLIHH